MRVTQRADDDGERHRTGVRVSDAPLGQRSCPPEPWRQLCRGVRRVLGDGGRRRQRFDERNARRSPALAGSGRTGRERRRGSCRRPRRLAEALDAAERGGNGGRDIRVSRAWPRAVRARWRSGRSPQSAPDVPPALSDHASAASVSSCAESVSVATDARAELTAASTPRRMPIPWSPSPAMASSSAKLGLVSLDDRAGDLEQPRRHDRCRAFFLVRFVHGKCARRPRHRSRTITGRSAMTPLRKAGVSGRIVPQPLEFVVDPEQGERHPAHVEAGHQLAAPPGR